jgi:hypothetical protein
MTSTYSSNLRLELIGTGDQSSTWGSTTNTNLGTLLEQAISGVSDVVFSTDADKTLSTVNGGTDEARQMIINLTSTVVGGLTATRNVIIPSVDKLYVVKNGTSGGRSIVVKTSAGSGVTITNGETTMVWCDGTNVYSALDYTPALTIGAGGLSLQGNFVVGGAAPNDAVGINVDTTLVSSTTTQYGVLVQPIYDDTATVGIYGNRSLLTGGAAASSYTTSGVFNYRSGNFTLGTNQKVTDFYGFYGDSLTAATNNYGVHLNTAAAAASTITSIVGSAGTVTVTTSGVHGLATGDKVLIANVTGTMTSGSYNGGPYTVTVTNTTVFTYSSAATSSALTTGSVVKANNWNLYVDGTGNSSFNGPVITNVSSTLPAMRITQTGTGDAFVVEDSTNPDTTPFVISASGSVGIGTTSPSTNLNVYSATSANISVDGDAGTLLRATRYSTDTTPTELVLRKARGTLASPSTVATSDTTGGLFFQAYGGTNFRNVGCIDGLVETYTSDSNIAGALRFYTNGSSTDVTERMRITSTGNVGIGSSTLTVTSLRVSKNITGGTTAYGVFSDGAFQSDITSSAIYFGTDANAVSGTTTSLIHYRANQSSLGTVTVSNQYGFQSDNGLIGATNNYAFNASNTAAVTAGKTAYGFRSDIDIATGGGTTYGFYASGTAVNYFNGNVGIANTSPACKLDVTGGIQTSRTTVTSPAATDGNIFSGTYTPTLTNTTNVASSTASAAQYMRVGNVVTVSGSVIIDPTTAATNTTLNVSLPIASSLTSGRQLGGAGSSNSAAKYGDNVLAIYADTTNDRAEFRFNPTGAASETYVFSFTYQVL